MDESTDAIHEDDVYTIWPQVDEADKNEISQFVKEKAFRKIKLKDLGEDAVLVDSIWVRKWKRTEQRKIVKSRLCARGCHDPFKPAMSNRSTIRPPQPTPFGDHATNKREPLESWDVAGAFLD